MLPVQITATGPGPSVSAMRFSISAFGRIGAGWESWEDEKDVIEKISHHMITS